MTRTGAEPFMAETERSIFMGLFDKMKPVSYTHLRVNAYPSTPTQMGLVFCDELGMLYIDDRTGGPVSYTHLTN